MNHDSCLPSSWVRRWCGVIEVRGRVLDLACGSGRHTHFLLDCGFSVVAVDLEISSLNNSLTSRADVVVRQADLENEPWPFENDCFDAVIVTNYLHRPLFAHLIASLKPGGVLIYETFASGNGQFGRPNNPNFLLQPGELLAVVEGSTRVVAYEDVYVENPKPALVQRICAVRHGGRPRHFPVPVN